MKKKNNGIYILISTIIFCVFGYYTVNNILFHLEERENIKIDDNGIADGVENIYDAVVSVSVTNGNQSTAVGSGFFISKDGYILTNHHVIEDNTDYSIYLNEKYISAEFIGSDEYADIAVLKVDSSYVSKVALIGNSEDMRVGDTVFAVGSPVNIKYAGTVTRGIISSKSRLIETSVSSDGNDWLMDVIQTDAAINNGNSGGPLCNASGEVIGVNTLKISTSNVESIAFAIPIESAINYANMIINGNKIERPMLGIRMSNVYKSLSSYGIYLDSSIIQGVVVIEPIIGGPSEKAGLQKGDVIVKLGENNVNNIAELNYYLFKYNSGDKVKLEVVRNNKNINIEVVLGKKEN